MISKHRAGGNVFSDEIASSTKSTMLIRGQGEVPLTNCMTDEGNESLIGMKEEVGAERAPS